MNEKRIELMRPDPHVFHNGAHVKISGVQIELFRIIVLKKGIVSNESISNLRNTAYSSVKSQIRYLREQLATIGCENLIKVERGTGYSASLQGWDLDSQSLESLVCPLDTSLNSLILNPIPQRETRTQIDTLKSALARWRANPADGLVEEYQYIHSNFESLKEKASNRLLMARLYSGDHGEIREAIIDLRVRTRNDPDLEVWKVLLYATDAIGGSFTKIIDEINQRYRHHPKRELQELVVAIQSGALRHNPFTVAPIGSTVNVGTNPPTQSDQTGLLHLCSQIGISTASQLRLADSHISPLECIRRTRSRLDFSGVLASKWVQRDSVRSEFELLLGRLVQERGSVRFLIINPFGEAFQRLRELRDGMISTGSLDSLRMLEAKYSSFSVRLFDALPAFRIVSIDDDVLSFSPYRLSASAYLASKSGWDSPHVVLDPLADYSLADAFRLLFSDSWERAIPLGQVPNP